MFYLRESDISQWLMPSQYLLFIIEGCFVSNRKQWSTCACAHVSAVNRELLTQDYCVYCRGKYKLNQYLENNQIIVYSDNNE